MCVESVAVVPENGNNIIISCRGVIPVEDLPEGEMSRGQTTFPLHIPLLIGGLNIGGTSSIEELHSLHSIDCSRKSKRTRQRTHQAADLA